MRIVLDQEVDLALKLRLKRNAEKGERTIILRFLGKSND